MFSKTSGKAFSSLRRAYSTVWAIVNKDISCESVYIEMLHHGTAEANARLFLGSLRILKWLVSFYILRAIISNMHREEEVRQICYQFRLYSKSPKAPLLKQAEIVPERRRNSLR